MILQSPLPASRGRQSSSPGTCTTGASLSTGNLSAGASAIDATQSEGTPNNMGAIVGGSLGGLALSVGAIVAVVYMLRHRWAKSTTPRRHTPRSRPRTYTVTRVPRPSIRQVDGDHPSCHRSGHQGSCQPTPLLFRQRSYRRGMLSHGGTNGRKDTVSPLHDNGVKDEYTPWLLDRVMGPHHIVFTLRRVWHNL